MCPDRSPTARWDMLQPHLTLPVLEFFSSHLRGMTVAENYCHYSNHYHNYYQYISFFSIFVIN